MRNYQIIYKKLIKEIKDELENCENLLQKTRKEEDLREVVELKGQIMAYEWLLTLPNEIEGKSCHNIIFNQEDFKKWKKKIISN